MLYRGFSLELSLVSRKKEKTNEGIKKFKPLCPKISCSILSMIPGDFCLFILKIEKNI